MGEGLWPSKLGIQMVREDREQWIKDLAEKVRSLPATDLFAVYMVATVFTDTLRLAYDGGVKEETPKQDADLLAKATALLVRLDDDERKKITPFLMRMLNGLDADEAIRQAADIMGADVGD